jgi:hypothetical protein
MEKFLCLLESSVSENPMDSLISATCPTKGRSKSFWDFTVDEVKRLPSMFPNV